MWVKLVAKSHVHITVYDSTSCVKWMQRKVTLFSSIIFAIRIISWYIWQFILLRLYLLERISWNQPISSPTLETLFGSIGDVILHLSSDRSFADKLLKVAKINEFINEIKMLSSGVELYRKIDTENQTHQPGKVFVYEVKLRCQENELTVIPEVHALHIFYIIIFNLFTLCCR